MRGGVLTRPTDGWKRDAGSRCGLPSVGGHCGPDTSLAALTETSFMMGPEQEAGLKYPAWLERIARAHLRGLEAFLRKRAAAQ